MTVQRVETVSDLTDAQREAVTRLLAAATTADGVRPLSEQFLLGLRPGSGSSHLIAGSADVAEVAGYAQVAGDAAELVVAPSHRRQGVGTALLAALADGVRIWSHGDLAGAAAFATASGLEVSRELYLLWRPLDDADPLPEPVLPPELVVRHFEPGRDEQEWLRVNAAAFRDHAEQGRLTRADLDTRMAQPWFDRRGLLLVVAAGEEDRVAAFHWTKVDPVGGRTGEVYVVGVDPAYQGQGLGRPVTLLGLHHLRRHGVSDVVLYVDGDNPAALRVYRSLGFTTRGLDRMYSRTVHRAVER